MKIGADNWIEKDSYRKGTKEHKEEVKERPDKVKHHKEERAENGYSWFDWINFDSFIAGIVATAVLKFAEDGVGYFPIGGEFQDPEYPYDYPDGTHENFVATCGAIYYALTEWLNDGNMVMLNETDVKYQEAREAMILFAEHLGSWWD